MTPRGADTTGSAAALVDRIRTRAGRARGSTPIGSGPGARGSSGSHRPDRAAWRQAEPAPAVRAFQGRQWQTPGASKLPSSAAANGATGLDGASQCPALGMSARLKG
jgi:hypothetical protein